MKLLVIFISTSILFGSLACEAQSMTYKLYPSKTCHGKHKRRKIIVVKEPICRNACGYDYTCMKFFFDRIDEFQDMSFVFRKTDTQMIGISKDVPNKGCQESIIFDLNDSINTERLAPWNSPIGVSTKLEKKTAKGMNTEYSYSFGYIIPSTASYLLYVIFDNNFNIIGVTYKMLGDGEVEFRPKKSI